MCVALNIRHGTQTSERVRKQNSVFKDIPAALVCALALVCLVVLQSSCKSHARWIGPPTMKRTNMHLLSN